MRLVYEALGEMALILIMVISLLWIVTKIAHKMQEKRDRNC